MKVDRPYVVSGAGASAYHCPDLAATDRHIAHVRRRLQQDRDGRVERLLQADMDRLLDHRYVLAATQGQGSP